MNAEIKVTPMRNQDSIEITVEQELVPYGTSLSFSDTESAASHPLGSDLLNIPGVASVWIMGKDIMVTKEEKARWAILQSRVLETIKTHCG